jgi:tetrahydromethanopterin S-methyltransferase subunit A
MEAHEMVDKKSPADGWPVISGDYVVGDPESPVAVTTLASHIEADLTGAAIAGPCKTENLGIEKVVANIISNPNIRFLILAGAEVQGHITGQSFKALHENGADPDKKKIIGATGAIPFVENVPLEGVERFQQQLEIVDLIDTEDIGAIQAKINECVEKDSGAFEAEPIVMEVDEKNECLVIVPDKKDKNKEKS